MVPSKQMRNHIKEMITLSIIARAIRKTMIKRLNHIDTIISTIRAELIIIKMTRGKINTQRATRQAKASYDSNSRERGVRQI